MTTKNDVTGDDIRSRATTDLYRTNWDRIFGGNTQQPQSTDHDQTSLEPTLPNQPPSV